MRRALLLTLALAACSSPPPAVAGTASATSLMPWLDAARTEVQASLDQMVDARRRHDVEGALALRAPDATMLRDDGTRLDRAQLDELLRASDRRVLDIGPESRVTIDRIESWSPPRPWTSEDEAVLVVRTTQRFVRTVMAEGSGLPQQLDTTTPHRETWRRTPEGWLQVEVVELAE
ncbi:MAG TPA: hypothetical protein VFY71_09920 [Planctomycetota bacterium]|nr:hypothetical protein [Planctomycetota bacterium]